MIRRSGLTLGTTKTRKRKGGWSGATVSGSRTPKVKRRVSNPLGPRSYQPYPNLRVW